jgi:hypothetical protein
MGGNHSAMSAETQRAGPIARPADAGPCFGEMSNVRTTAPGKIRIQYAPVPRAIVLGVSHMIFRSHHIDHEAT